MALDRDKVRRVLAEKLSLEDAIARIFTGDDFYTLIYDDPDAFVDIVIDGGATFTNAEWTAIKKVITARTAQETGEATP